MNTKILIAVLGMALLLAASVAALANGDLEIPHWVISGGGIDASSGDISFNATLGQPVVGVISSGEVAIEQGFWYRKSGYGIYLPLITK